MLSRIKWCQFSQTCLSKHRKLTMPPGRTSSMSLSLSLILRVSSICACSLEQWGPLSGLYLHVKYLTLHLLPSRPCSYPRNPTDSFCVAPIGGLPLRLLDIMWHNYLQFCIQSMQPLEGVFSITFHRLLQLLSVSTIKEPTQVSFRLIPFPPVSPSPYSSAMPGVANDSNILPCVVACLLGSQWYGHFVGCTSCKLPNHTFLIFPQAS